MYFNNDCRLLVGGCSELLRECLEVHLPEEACLVLPNIDLWEFKVGASIYSIFSQAVT